jgi:hypothetical protein
LSVEPSVRIAFVVTLILVQKEHSTKQKMAEGVALQMGKVTTRGTEVANAPANETLSNQRFVTGFNSTKMGRKRQGDSLTPLF